MRYRLPTLLLPFALAIVVGFPALAQDGAEEDLFDRSAENCIRVSEIRETTIVDDESILFHMRRNRIYRNFLDSSCQGLARRGRFSYTARGGRLCSSDTITVPDSFVRRFNEGTICRLGRFQPISREEAAAIEDGPDAVGNLVITDIEIPPEDEDEDEADVPTRPESE